MKSHLENGLFSHFSLCIYNFQCSINKRGTKFNLSHLWIRSQKIKMLKFLVIPFIFLAVTKTDAKWTQNKFKQHFIVTSTLTPPQWTHTAKRSNVIWKKRMSFLFWNLVLSPFSTLSLSTSLILGLIFVSKFVNVLNIML